jgi:flavin reductase (DIM6/NTAB) family NADH-FMN oxidoreductase RutF
MILVSLDQNSDLLKIIQESGRFGVNVLASGQQSLATTFARKGADKFAGVAWYMDHGAPRLAGKGQWLVCRTDQLITAGDHVIIIGLVVHADTHSFEPLLYRQRAFGTVTHMRSYVRLRCACVRPRRIIIRRGRTALDAPCAT